MTFIGPDAVPKRLDLLREIAPGLKRVGFLGAVGDPNTGTFLREIRLAADAMGAALHPILVSGRAEFSSAFAQFAAQAMDAVVVQPLFIIDHSAEIAGARAPAPVSPTISDEGRYAKAGGLMTYGVEWLKLTRRADAFGHKILEGRQTWRSPDREPRPRSSWSSTSRRRRRSDSKAPAVLLARADEVIE